MELVKSDWLEIQAAVCADPPSISVVVIGLDERRQLERNICDLINKRDRLINFVAKGVTTVTDMLSKVEALLDDCLTTVRVQYTGHLLANVSWTCQQSNDDVEITGYHILVNGKQYGSLLHEGVDCLRIKVGVSRPMHQISLVAHYKLKSDADRKPLTVESNVIELTTEQYHAFAFYSFISQLTRAVNDDESYIDTLVAERRRPVTVIDGNKVPLNEGLLLWQPTGGPSTPAGPPAPQCAVLDVLSGEYRPLMSRNTTANMPYANRRPTALLFWSQRSSSSRKYLGWFVDFARHHRLLCECLAVTCCQSQSVTEATRQQLVSDIVDSQWRDDDVIQHVTNHALAKSNNSAHLVGGDLCSVLGVFGVPMIVVLHPLGITAWRGRYCAFNYDAFEHFMRYVLAQVTSHPVPEPDPWDPDITSLLQETSTSQRRHVASGRMSANGYSSSSYSTPTSSKSGSVKHQRLFAKRSARSRRAELTINARPFSASHSPYEEKLANSAPPAHLRKNSRKANSVQ